ncbi:MAG: DUF4325 domain-containing protein [Parcubacteria group bacterium]
MIITLKKFGMVLTSRQAGREALAAFKPSLQSVGVKEQVVLDFSGVATLSPSWADEFITPLFKKYGARLRSLSADNLSVEASLKTLELHLEAPSDTELSG